MCLCERECVHRHHRLRSLCRCRRRCRPKTSTMSSSQRTAFTAKVSHKAKPPLTLGALDWLKMAIATCRSKSSSKGGFAHLYGEARRRLTVMSCRTDVSCRARRGGGWQASQQNKFIAGKVCQLQGIRPDELSLLTQPVPSPLPAKIVVSKEGRVLSGSVNLFRRPCDCCTIKVPRLAWLPHPGWAIAHNSI